MVAGGTGTQSNTDTDLSTHANTGRNTQHQSVDGIALRRRHRDIATGCPHVRIVNVGFGVAQYFVMGTRASTRQREADLACADGNSHRCSHRVAVDRSGGTGRDEDISARGTQTNIIAGVIVRSIT